MRRWRERSERPSPPEAHEQRAAEKGRDARREGAKAEGVAELRRTTERPTNEADRPFSAARGSQAALATFPLRMHRVHTSSRFTPPPTFARTDCRLGFQRRRVRL